MWQIDRVMRFGREAYTRSAVIYAIGRKEIKAFGRFLEPCEGIHVLCSPQDGAIITQSKMLYAAAVKNHEFTGGSALRSFSQAARLCSIGESQ